MLGIIKFVLKLLGFLEKVRAHTRHMGAVSVSAYWRRA